MKLKLFLLSAFFIVFFTYFSYTVAKEKWQQFDFDTTVKLQDHISREFDFAFSFFSLLGSAEVTTAFCLLLAFLSLIRGKLLPVLGWSLIVLASILEVFGKLVLFHPGPPVFLHRSLLSTSLPSFYVHTDFSYPSGHMTRTIFIVTILICMVFFSSKNIVFKLAGISLLLLVALLMGLTRVYLGEHWTTDVVGGLFLGVGFGLFAAVFILMNPRIDFKKEKGLI